jgi:hypothetical protein
MASQEALDRPCRLTVTWALVVEHHERRKQLGLEPFL